MNLSQWLDLLPVGLGLFVIVVAAGILGLFRSMALSKQSYTDTVESLQRQVKVLEHEVEVLNKVVANYQKQLETCKRCVKEFGEDS